MASVMKKIALITIVLTIVFCALFHYFNNGIFFTLAITFGTTAYHFSMRLMIGYVIDFIFKNKVNYNRRCFKVGNFEMNIYKIINVKKWKDKMPTYDPESFDVSKHS